MATTQEYTGEYSEKTWDIFHKLFSHIREFPDIDPSVGDIDDTNYDEEYIPKYLKEQP